MRRTSARPATVGRILTLVGERRLPLDELALHLGVDAEQLETIVDQLVAANLLTRTGLDGRPAVERTEAGRRRNTLPEPVVPAAPTDELTEALCAELRLGRSLERACAVCQLPQRVVRRWLAAGERASAAGRSDELAAFAEAVVRARVDSAAAFASALVRTAEVDWKAAAALLRSHDSGYSGSTAEDDDATAPPRRATAGRRDA
jgi:hypothetical protein